MSVYVEVNGSNRSSQGLQVMGLKVNTGLQRVGICSGTLQSLTNAWRPSQFETLELWEPIRTVTDAAITASLFTLTSATAAFVAADVGTHVRIAGAGVGGGALRTMITARTNSTTVTVEDAATGTVSSAACLIGRARFFGSFQTEIEETKLTSSASGRFPFVAQDKAAHLLDVYPVLTRGSESLFARVTAIVADGLDEHGITLSWPLETQLLCTEAGVDLCTEAGDDLESNNITDLGGTVAAAVYEGRVAAGPILDALVLEDGTGRIYRVDELGRLRVVPPTVDTLPQTLTAANLLFESVKKRNIAKDYRNVQFCFYGDPLTGVSSENSTERAAVGPIFGPPEVNVAWSVTEAQARADALISLYATRSRYLVNATTTVEGIRPGQSGTVTYSDRAIAGTHLVMAVVARYVYLAGQTWLFDLTLVSGTSRVEEDAAYWGTVQ